MRCAPTPFFIPHLSQVVQSVWTDEEVDGRSEVYIRRLGTAECPYFLAEDSKQKLHYSWV
jgi:hypothetical protein